MPDSALDEIGGADALLLGAVGARESSRGAGARSILLECASTSKYANLRPARSYRNVPLPVRLPSGGRLDTLVVRENTEDFYIG